MMPSFAIVALFPLSACELFKYDIFLTGVSLVAPALSFFFFFGE